MTAGLSVLSRRRTTGLWSGLAILRGLEGRRSVVGLVLIAVFAQIARNWLALHAIGVDASVFDAVAVLIALVTLSQLPLGLLSATGLVGTLCYGGGALADRLRPLPMAAA